MIGYAQFVAKNTRYHRGCENMASRNFVQKNVVTRDLIREVIILVLFAIFNQDGTNQQSLGKYGWTVRMSL